MHFIGDDTQVDDGVVDACGATFKNGLPHPWLDAHHQRIGPGLVAVDVPQCHPSLVRDKGQMVDRIVHKVHGTVLAHLVHVLGEVFAHLGPSLHAILVDCGHYPCRIVVTAGDHSLPGSNRVGQRLGDMACQSGDIGTGLLIKGRHQRLGQLDRTERECSHSPAVLILLRQPHSHPQRVFIFNQRA